MAIEKDWRSKELSLQEVIDKYPEVSPFVIIKTDVQRRGLKYSENALKKVNPHIHQTQHRSFGGDSKGSHTPISIILRDGTTVLQGETSCSNMLPRMRDPYLVDVRDGKVVLVDEGNIIEEVFYAEKPDFYDKFTSKGTPMWQVAWARPQRLDLNPHQYCEFWKTPGHGCKYCAIAAAYKNNQKPALVDMDDIAETVAEALKEKGRFTNIMLTGGTILSGKEILDDEVDRYIEILQRIGVNFKHKKFPSQLIGTAFNENQLRRLYENTGLMSYTADIEVPNKRLFEWICPGKAEVIGYDEWKERLYQAVDIFGKGRVNTGLVSGVELAQPEGFATESEAEGAILDEARELAKHGVSTVSCVWGVVPGSIFFNQMNPSLEYFIRLAKGFDGIRREYGLDIDMDNYRRCGNHPDTDLSRI